MNTVPQTMQALQLVAPGELKQVELPVPQPGPDELLIRTASTTICTSDLNDIAHNPFKIELPRVLGHEAAGVVCGAGGEIKAFRLGAKVAVHPVIPCLRCENCRRGLGHLCMQMGHLGLDRDGTFAEYFCIRADRARRLPRSVSFEFASLLEPVAVCLEAVQRGRIQRDDSVLIVGDGPFGIMIARLALRCHPRRVVLVGRHDFRLAQVPEAVAIHQKHTSNVFQAILQANDGVGMDVAIMAAGTESALDLSLHSLRARGRAVVFSATNKPLSVDLFRLHTQELEILGSCNDESLVDRALRCLGDPELKLASLITHRLPFPEWSRALELASSHKDEALKVALVFPGAA